MLSYLTILKRPFTYCGGGGGGGSKKPAEQVNKSDVVKRYKEIDDTLDDLRLSLTANPRNPDALFALYKYYFDKADYRKAQYYLRQVVALNPENSKLTELNAQLDSLIK